METQALEFFKRIIETPSPSGFEQPVQKLIRERLKDSVDDLRTDVHRAMWLDVVSRVQAQGFDSPAVRAGV